MIYTRFEITKRWLVRYSKLKSSYSTMNTQKTHFPTLFEYKRFYHRKQLMKRFAVIAFALIVTLAVAEKYAMVFGTANGWDNYSIASVRPVFDLNSRIHAVCIQI